MSGESVQIEARDEFEDYLVDAMRDPDFAGAYRDAGRRRSLLVELIELRRSLGLTQTFVAVEMGTTQSAVSELECGADDPRVSTLQRYARAIGKRLVIDIEDREELTAPPVSSVLPVGGLGEQR